MRSRIRGKWYKVDAKMSISSTLSVRDSAVHWKLREVMARIKMKNKDLAVKIVVHENSISGLKASDEMPRIDGEILDKLCSALGCKLSDLFGAGRGGQR